MRTPWLFFIFHLPASSATQHVNVWRRLQKYGALGWKNSAYVLPHNAANVEKFQWLAREIRKCHGEASIVEVARIARYTDKEVIARFDRARGLAYERLIQDMRLCLRGAAGRSAAELLRHFTRLNRRLTEIAAIDAFGCGRKKEAESLLRELEARYRADKSLVCCPGNTFT